MVERLTIDRAATYRIKIQGSMSQSWTDYLGALEIDVSHESDWPVTTLSGFVQDQAALLGVLNGLYDLGYPLLTVECEISEAKETEN
jgi:hypothetical protein